ncbi:uncharacterized protein LOC134208883 [Armigeres subalbatus]|uniref:uncharacterized protein LOC134208883 n=1 Tax=Armigeres subalbatus TaxID=124917 RepID=UPI002ED4A5EC
MNADKWANEYPLAAAAIKDKTYMDDYYDSADSPEEAAKLAKQVRSIHAHGGFEMRNWVSNSGVVLEELGESVARDPRLLQSTIGEKWERVLGMLWHPESDALTFCTELGEQLLFYINGDKRPTKRIALRIIMSLFDPLGLLAPYLIHGRTLIQDLWRSGIQWDEEMRDAEFTKWMRWVELLPGIRELSLPRYYFGDAQPISEQSLQCHVFTDASETGYGCAVYFRAIDEFGCVRCSLIMARSKVAPLKHLSIPRLELEAAVLGAKLLNNALAYHSLQPRNVYLWTDSSTVFSWIRSDHRRYKQFVAHRIGEILSLTQAENWRWVPSKNNVADCLTKWVHDTEPDSSGRWFKGPAFLYLSEDLWPQHFIKTNTTEELRSTYVLAHISLPIGIIDTSRVSKWSILLRTVACLYRFVNNCRLRISKRPIETFPATRNQQICLKRTIASCKTPLKQEEFQKAEQFLWRAAQSEFYQDEIRTLLKNRDQTIAEWSPIEKSSPIYQLSPFADEFGVIRMEGRTANAIYANFDARFPIILPKDSQITQRLLEFYDHRCGHASKELVVNEVRQRFEISHLRSAVDKISRNCVFCKVNKCKPSPPRMAPLLQHRLTPYVRPFSYVGIYYMGPLEVTVGRHKEKRYVAVFTCLVVRAVHLEVAYDLSSESCIMAIRRFSRRRGSPVNIFSDNGTNFVGANRELQKQIQQINLASAGTFTDARTKWSFNPPSAPHMGGVWERMVRSVKEAMAALNDGRKLTDEILWTVVVETEGLINSRPLTYMPQEINSTEALTPNHFILGCSTGAHEPLEPPTNVGQVLRSSFQRSQQLADVAWKRWVNEYFPTINKRTKWLDDVRSVKVGDLVYVSEGKRRSWIRGFVEETIPGKDGRVRQAVVRTASGKPRRPVIKLAVLELGGSTEDPPLDPRGGGCSGNTTSEPSLPNAESSTKRTLRSSQQ